LSQLLLKEVNFQLKLEELKKRLEISYDFTVKRAYASVDDWNYGYLDHSNIRRFLKNMGYRASKKEIVAILRRLDMDGDAKVSFKEFEAGFMPVTTKLTRPKSGT
jgi:Ca2+-binding EF-hand superfamily protein